MGEIVNLMSNDAQRLQDLMTNIIMLFSSPFVITIAVLMLWKVNCNKILTKNFKKYLSKTKNQVEVFLQFIFNLYQLYKNKFNVQIVLKYALF